MTDGRGDPLVIRPIQGEQTAGTTEVVEWYS